MPGLLRSVLGFIILVATIGLATCQSMVRAEPVNSHYAAEIDSAIRTQAQ